MHAIQILKAYVYIYICVCVCTWICISLVRGESWWPPEIRWWMHPSWCAPSLRLLRPSWPSANPIGSKSWVSRPSLGYQWIGLRENLPETMNFPMKCGVSCDFSLKPIHWVYFGWFCWYIYSSISRICFSSFPIKQTPRKAREMRCIYSCGWH